MPNISTYFRLRARQTNLDFVDIVLEDDNLLFIDPRLIESSTRPGDRQMKNSLATFFGNFMSAIVTGNRNRVLALLGGIQEPKETRLGYGDANSNGRSAGNKLKEDLVDAIMANPVMARNIITNLSNIPFFVPNIGIDRMSDITTKVIKRQLITFTQRQCILHGIPTVPVLQTGIFNHGTVQWTQGNENLPVFNDGGVDKPIIFVPKHLVCRSTDASSGFNSFFRFARNYILDNGPARFYRGVPRNGKGNTIKKKDFDATLGPKKDELTKWVLSQPQIIGDHWNQSIGNVRPLSDAEIGTIVY